MKKYILLTLILIFSFIPAFSIGYNVNVGVTPGLSGYWFGEHVEKNQYQFSDVQNLLTYGNYVTADVVFNNDISVEAGIGYKASAN